MPTQLVLLGLSRKSLVDVDKSRDTTAMSAFMKRLAKLLRIYIFIYLRYTKVTAYKTRRSHTSRHPLTVEKIRTFCF